MMQFADPLIPAKVIKRYKRFLTDVTLDSGEEVTVHCANSGSMKTCIDSGWRAMLSDSKNPKRKLRYTLELVHNGLCWICVNTQRANAVVAEAIAAGQVPELAGYDSIKREVKYGNGSRIDIFLESDDKPPCYVEIKTVSMLGEDGKYQFPDAVTTRGLKHLQELRDTHEAGHRAVLLFLVMRSDGEGFRAADSIDPAYAEALDEVTAAGVEVLVYGSDISETKLGLGGRIQ